MRLSFQRMEVGQGVRTVTDEPGIPVRERITLVNRSLEQPPYSISPFCFSLINSPFCSIDRFASGTKGANT